MLLPLVRAESLPETLIGKSYYRDTGCSIAPECLECPLPQCRYDQVPETTGPRNAEMRKLKAEGSDVATLMIQFDLSNRQIHRIVASK